jgi:hypothetical protein
MAIISNPPPKGMIGRAVKPLAWHRSERAPTDPALTTALTPGGTESGPRGLQHRPPAVMLRRPDETIFQSPRSRPETITG